jgi:hypothetical protein
MLKGIHLTLLIGPAVPVPPPKSVIDALESVQVTSSAKGRSGFQLTFAVSKKSPLLTTMLPTGYFDPITTRVIIVVTLSGLPNVLMDGIVTRQELSPSSDPGQSRLTITGEDLSVLMDLVENPFMRFPAMDATVQILTLLAKYLVFGIVPMVLPPFFPDIPDPIERIQCQTGTDFEYINSLAGEYGYVFYVEPGPLPGASLAYWGPDIRLPIPQGALNINMDAQTNVESMSFSLDGLAKKIVVVTVFDPFTDKITVPIPVPNLNPLKPPLGLRPTPPSRVEFPTSLSKYAPSEVVNKIIGILINSSDAITVSGSLDTLRYGRVLRARMIVGVRGSGLAYDGFYYVNSVTHNLKRGEYKQSFNLSRDGLISNTPNVPV